MPTTRRSRESDERTQAELKQERQDETNLGLYVGGDPDPGLSFKGEWQSRSK